MLIVGLTSATASVGVAVARDGKVLAARQLLTDRRHAEEITPLLTDTLITAGVTPQELDLVAVDIGPGRFTGLRVGLATARGLALGLSIPMVGISSLELLAEGIAQRPVVAVIDARRNEVFQQVYDLHTISDPVVGPPDELALLVPDSAVIVGDGADRYSELYGSGVVVAAVPSAETLVRLAANRPSRPGPEVLPLYLRDPDVQVNIKTRPIAGGAA